MTLYVRNWPGKFNNLPVSNTINYNIQWLTHTHGGAHAEKLESNFLRTLTIRSRLGARIREGGWKENFGNMILERAKNFPLIDASFFFIESRKFELEVLEVFLIKTKKYLFFKFKVKSFFLQCEGKKVDSSMVNKKQWFAAVTRLWILTRRGTYLHIFRTKDRASYRLFGFVSSLNDW